MTNRTVTKQRLGEQDVLWGTGTEEQQRGAGTYPMKRVTRVRAIPTWADFADAEPEYPGQQYSYNGAIFQHAPDSTATVEVVGSLAITTEGAVLVNISAPTTVAVLADIPMPQKGQVAKLSAGGRSGDFIWTLGDYSSEVASDTLQGIYVESNTVAASAGCWVRNFKEGYVELVWFGYVYSQDNNGTAAISEASQYLENNGGGVIIYAPGEVRATGITLKNKVIHRGAGRNSTVIRALTSVNDFISLDTGAIQDCGFQSLTISGETADSSGIAVNAGQWGVKLDAVDVGGVGGWWFGVMEKVTVRGFDNGVWLNAGDNFQLPHQFLLWKDFTVIRNDAGGVCLRLQNQCEQILGLRCRFDAVAGSTTGTSVDLVSGTVTDPRANKFIKTTIQNSQKAIQSSGSGEISFSESWFENIAECLTLSGVNRSFKIGGRFANAANGGGSGYIISAAGTGNVEFEPSTLAGTTDSIVAAAGSSIYIDISRIANSSSAATISATGSLSKQISEAAGTISCGMGKSFLLNSSVTEIATIDSDLVPGESIFIKPLGGSSVFNKSGNITFSGTSPLTIPQNEVIQLVRYDISGTWQIVNK